MAPAGLCGGTGAFLTDPESVAVSRTPQRRRDPWCSWVTGRSSACKGAAGPPFPLSLAVRPGSWALSVVPPRAGFLFLRGGSVWGQLPGVWTVKRLLSLRMMEPLPRWPVRGRGAREAAGQQGPASLSPATWYLIQSGAFLFPVASS